MTLLNIAQAGGGMGRYLDEAKRFPMLNPGQERDLAIAWRERGDEEALRLLTGSHLRLVIKIARGFAGYGLPASELIAEGNVGLMQAAQKFDPDRGFRFATYAIWWIRAAIQEYILHNWSMVKMGTTAAQKSLFFNLRRLRAKIEDASSNGALTQAGRMKIATELKVEVHEVEAMEMRLSGADQSLNAPISDSSEDDWQDFLADQRPSPEDVVIGMRDSNTRSKWLAEALGELSPRERTIIAQRRLRDDGATLEELGKELGVSKERVRQLEHRAMLKLKESMMRRVELSSDLLLEM